MNRVFADTSYWVALLNPRDELHEKAVAAAAEFSDAQFFTSQMVLAEFLNGFSERGPQLRSAASKAVQILQGTPNVTMIP